MSTLANRRHSGGGYSVCECRLYAVTHFHCLFSAHYLYRAAGVKEEVKNLNSRVNKINNSLDLKANYALLPTFARLSGSPVMDHAAGSLHASIS